MESPERQATDGPEYTFNPLPKQDTFIFSESKFPAFIAGVGSGKTLAGCIRAVIHLLQGRTGMIVAPTYPMLRDITQRTLFEILDGMNLHYTYNKAEGVIQRGKAIVYLRSSDKPDRLRGVNLAWAYLDEAALMREMVWKVILGRLRMANPCAWITTTPAGYNWVWQQWVEMEDPNYEIIHATSRDNIYLPHEYIEDLVASYSEEFAQQEIEGEFVAFAGLVYKEFSRNYHIQDFDVPDSWQRVRAVDYGYTNPFVCLWGALDEDRILYIYYEHYQPKQLIKEHASTILSIDDKVFSWTVADHDAQDNAEMADNGIPTRRASKEVIQGIQKVKARLQEQPNGKPRLIIHPRCVNLIKELGMYRWAKQPQGGNVKEEPVKENDHACDALRYMVMEIDHGGFVLV